MNSPEFNEGFLSFYLNAIDPDTADRVVLPPPFIDRVLENELPWKNFYELKLDVSSIFKKYGWFFTKEGSNTFLVMPIRNRLGRIISYVERFIAGKCENKYRNSPGHKFYWISDYVLQILQSNKVIILCESIADAVYIHELTNYCTIALLGTGYNRTLDTFFVKKKVYIMLDGGNDKSVIIPKEKFLALNILGSLKISGIESNIIQLPIGIDPTDLPPKDLIELIKLYIKGDDCGL